MTERIGISSCVFRTTDIRCSDNQAPQGWPGPFLGRAPRARNRSVKCIAKVGRRRWKAQVGYHRQGQAENTFCRYKAMIGDRLRSRDLDAQNSEVILGCNILNRVFECGRPRSVATRD